MTEPERAGDAASGTPGGRWDPGLYDARHAFVWRHGASLVELLEPRPGERILDLGCGTGHLTARIAAAGAEVVGLDRSPEMIDRARAAYPHLDFRVADARDFAVPGPPFDAVFSNAALHWVREPARAVDRIRRALRPGGRFVAELGGRGNVRRIVAALDEAARSVGVGAWDGPWYFPALGAYAALLEGSGFEVTFAALFDRPTPLEGESGLRDWITMFAGDWLDRIPDDRRAGVLDGVEARLRPALHRDGAWHADYRRLRIVAHRAAGPSS